MLAILNAGRRGDFGADLGARQHAAVPRFRSLAQLDLDHLHLIRLRRVAKAFGIETPGVVAAAEIAAAELPDDVAAVRAVIGAESAFAGVVIEEIGRASCRERGCQYVSISVVAVSFKTKRVQ